MELPKPFILCCKDTTKRCRRSPAAYNEDNKPRAARPPRWKANSEGLEHSRLRKFDGEKEDSKISFMRCLCENDIFRCRYKCICFEYTCIPRIWEITLLKNLNEASQLQKWHHYEKLWEYENLVKVLQCSNPLLPCLLQLIHECQLWMQGRKWCSC